MAAMDSQLASAAATAQRLAENVASVVIGKPAQVRLLVTALACQGHLLLEDVPGTAKTVLARALAASIEGASSSRIQCTPDLQPTDVTGLTVWKTTGAPTMALMGPATSTLSAGAVMAVVAQSSACRPSSVSTVAQLTRGPGRSARNTA